MQPRRNAAWLAGACAILTLVLPTLGLADYIANIQLAHDGPTHFPHGERAYVSFDYDITVPGGARLRVAPYHDGSPMPSYSWSGSAVYGPGTGTHTTWFSYLTGDRTVDQYYVAMVSDDWSTTYLELLLPVNYFFGEHGIFNIETSHDSPSWIRRDSDLVIDFDYASTEAGGVRVRALPYHQGEFCAGCWGPADELLPPSGSSSTYFTFPSSDADVDQLRFTMRTADGDTLMDFFIPVDLHWRTHGIGNIALDPPGPEGLVHNEHLTATFDYDCPEPFRVWVHPFTDGWYTPHYAVQDGGVVPAGSGTLSRYCTIVSGDSWIDEIRLRMKNEASSEILLEVFVPVRYHYGAHAVHNVQFTPPGPAILTHDETVATTFDYSTTEAGGVRVFNLPFSDGAMCPSCYVSGSPLYPAGTGGGDNWFGISSGEECVDQLRYTMRNADQSVDLYEIFLDTRYWFGASGVFTPAPETPPAAVVLGPNYPNPFNPATTIPVTLAESRRVTLRVYDLRGRLVATLVDGWLAAGAHALPFRAEGLPSGVYLYTLDAAGERQAGRMVLLK